MRNAILNFALCTLPLILFSSCGNTKPSFKNLKCSDGTYNHTLVKHEKEEFDDKVGHEAYQECLKCSQLFDLDGFKIDAVVPIQPNLKILLKKIYNGEKLTTLDPVVKRYLSLEDEGEIAKYLYSHNSVHNCQTSGVTISWQDNGSAGNCDLELSFDENFSKVYKKIFLNSQSSTIYNLVPNKYFYRIKDMNGNCSPIDFFEIEDKVRTIHNSTNLNIRDIGGWETTTGDKIRYEKLYRCAFPSSENISTFRELKIKTELDLRMKCKDKDEIGTYTGLYNDLNFVMGLNEDERFWPQYDAILSNQEIVSKYFQKIFGLMSNEENYPFVFHCTHGADRTGTLAYIINGLCGVPYENLVRDFELTSFYYNNRYRSKIVENDGVYSFDEDGIMSETDNIRFNLFHSKLLADYGEGTKNISKAVLKYLTEFCSVDEEVIIKTLKILIEGDQYLNIFK